MKRNKFTEKEKRRFKWNKKKSSSRKNKKIFSYQNNENNWDTSVSYQLQQKKYKNEKMF